MRVGLTTKVLRETGGTTRTAFCGYSAVAEAARSLLDDDLLYREDPGIVAKGAT